MFRGEANLDFSRKYGRVMMAALLGALAVHVVAGAYSPPYAPTPYRLREENTVAVDVQDFEIAKPAHAGLLVPDKGLIAIRRRAVAHDDPTVRRDGVSAAVESPTGQVTM